MQGALTVSIDLELAWGVWDTPSAEYFRLCAEKERAIVADILRLFAAYEVSATWAIVGRLLERGASPVESREGERIWYAPELIDLIRRTRPAQEIGSHSYGHIYFNAASRQAIRSDLANVRRVHAAHGLSVAPFVFPRNQVSHLPLLAEAGVKVFRGADAGWQTTVQRRLGRVAGRGANLVEKATPTAPPAVEPIIRHRSPVELPGSMLLLGRSGARRIVHPAILEWKAARGLRRAQRTRRTFHLWFHPSNFYYDTDRQLRVLEGTLREACRLRDCEELEIRPMGSYADRPRPLAAAETHA